MPMPNRNVEGNYRYTYQGQENDPETGKEAFELRLWDARIGRWLTTDPYGQYSSPYLGMGNNPISMIDPDGGFACEECPNKASVGDIYTSSGGGEYQYTNEGWTRNDGLLQEVFIGTQKQWSETYQSTDWDFVNQVVKADFYNHIYRGQNEAAQMMSMIIPTPIVGLTVANGAYNSLKTANNIRKMNKVRRLGKIGEKSVAVAENLSQYAQKKIPSLTGTASKRFVDFMTPFALHEVKNVKYLRLTNQLKDFVLYSQRFNKHMVIHVRKSTKLSKELQALNKKGIIEFRYIK